MLIEDRLCLIHAVDEPKTSEYAFFKKLKTNAGRRFNSHPLQKEEIQPNKFKSSEFLRGRLFILRLWLLHHFQIYLSGNYIYVGRSSPIRNSSKDFRLPIEDGARVNCGLLHTPSGSALTTLNWLVEFVCTAVLLLCLLDVFLKKCVIVFIS